MILLDENNKLVHDEDEEPGEGTKLSLSRCAIVCAYATPDILYRFDPRGTLFIAYIATKKFLVVHIKPEELVCFQREHRLATRDFVVRDIGGGQSRVYLDAASFQVPTELLLR